MPTLRSHTHLQATQANAQTKACKRVCLPKRTADRPTVDREEQRRHNTQLPQVAVAFYVCCFCSRNLFILA
jgi:hypothetical protein